MSAPDPAWRPEILLESDPRDAERLALLRADPAVEFHDHLDGQRAELAELVPPLDEALRSEEARWVHYPWRRTVIRLLGPATFRRLRLDRNRNKITAAEQDALLERSVGVVGLSVGHAIAHTLALEGLCGELRLADFDEIEVSNLNRIPASLLDVGVNKAVVAARRIAELDPYLDIVIEPSGATEDNLDRFLDGLDLVIDECDSLDVKLRLREAARERGIAVAMETSDRGLIDLERFDLEPDRPPFHGLLDDLRAADLAGLSTSDKVPHVLRMLDAAELSPRFVASLVEIDETVTTWPQLGGDVTLGGATMAAVVRRLFRGRETPSGRTRIDLDAALDGLATPSIEPLVAEAPEPPTPRLAPDAPQAVLEAAALAPSGGNTQPWTLELRDDVLDIRLDRSKTSTMDLGFRGSYVAIGAALLNARIAAAAHGRLGRDEVFPAVDDPDLVARVHLGETLDLDLAALAPAMVARASNRHPGSGAPLDAATRDRLVPAVDGLGVHVLDDRALLDEVGDVLAEADRLRYVTEHLHRELMGELRWPGHDDLDEGIDVRTLEVDDTDLAKLSIMRRRDALALLEDWDAGRALGDMTRERIEACSAVAMVTVDGGSPADYVRGGVGMQRLWIDAELAGLGVQPASPVFLYATDRADLETLVPGGADRLAALQRRLHELVGLGDGERPILLLRLSDAPAPTLRSARRPVPSAVSFPSATVGVR